MSRCDPQEKDFQDKYDARNDLRDQLAGERRAQFDNYKEYWGEVRDAFAEYLILGLFGESALGGALGGYEMTFGTSSLEDRIDELHDEIEETKSDLADAEVAADAAGDDLCECYQTYGFE